MEEFMTAVIQEAKFGLSQGGIPCGFISSEKCTDRGSWKQQWVQEEIPEPSWRNRSVE